MKILFGIGTLLAMAMASTALGQTTQSMRYTWTGPATVTVGQTATFTLTADTNQLPGRVCLLSFGGVLDSLGAAASVQSITVLSPWTAIPMNPYPNGLAGFSTTALDGVVPLAQVVVLGVSPGFADLNLTFPVGDNRTVWNGSYLPVGDTVRTSCFVNPIEVSGAGQFQVVVPAPASAGVLGLSGLVAFRRRRTAR